MCGVFGFVSHGVEGPDLACLRRVASVTMRRGDHAFGFAWIDQAGRLRSYKQEGRMVDHLGLLSLAKGARMLIGHCRYATSGAPAQNINNHPHPSDGGWIVHNGQVSVSKSVRERYKLLRSSDCDSEWIALLIESLRGPVTQRVLGSVRALGEPELAVLGIWSRPSRLVAIRNGKPLHMGVAPTGYYLASLAEGLPGKVVEVADRKLIEFKERGLHHESL